MKDSLSNLTNQKILILGLGNEGWSTYRFLRRQLPDNQLAVADQRDFKEFAFQQQTSLQQDAKLTLFLGKQYLKKITNYSVIFKAPGIPKSKPEIKHAVDNGAQLTSNTQLFFELRPGQIIGVTGTKGKSTTAAVIHHVLKTHGLDAHLVGNIGQPALDFLEKINQATLVVFELSSHQLETLTMSPHIAVVQNISSEHLDYYSSTEEYQTAKSAITRYQTTDDIVIYNPAFSVAAQIASLSSGKHLRHSLDEGPESVAFIRQGSIVYKGPQGKPYKIIQTNKLPLIGKHNWHNVLPAVIIGGLFNVEPDEIGQALSNFKPLPHRLELVLEKNSVRYFDDSLSTLPDATIQALENFTEPVVLIAGGYERHQDFTQLATVILEKNVVGLVLFHPTGQRLAEAIKQAAGPHHALPTIKFAETMAEAVEKAHPMVPSTGGVMLMSPGSASFGRFKDYQDRGEQFQAAVKKTKKQ